MIREQSTVVIVGAGQGGMQAATSLRDEGFQGRIQLIGNEPCAPYQRPPLSKSFLAGAVEPEELLLEEPAFFARENIEFLSGEHAVDIDRAGRRVKLASGLDLPYDELILATGSCNRQLPCLSEPLKGVISLRTVEDATMLKSHLVEAKQVVIVGGGFLGLEAATMAVGMGARIHVVEAMGRLMERVISPITSGFFLARHEQCGIGFSFGRLVSALHDVDGNVTAVELDDGTLLPADLVIASIGVVPNTDLAVASKLEVNNGILVDEMLRTSDPAISAIGDCAAFPYALDQGERMRLESVQNAVDQARYIAQRLTGQLQPYEQVPIFWSEQAGVRLQIAGVAKRDDDCVLRGDPDSGGFSVFRYRQDRLVCVESVNRPADHMTGRRLLASKRMPTREQAVDPDFDLRQFSMATIEPQQV